MTLLTTTTVWRPSKWIGMRRVPVNIQVGRAGAYSRVLAGEGVRCLLCDSRFELVELEAHSIQVRLDILHFLECVVNRSSYWAAMIIPLVGCPLVLCSSNQPIYHVNWPMVSSLRLVLLQFNHDKLIGLLVLRENVYDAYACFVLLTC